MRHDKSVPAQEKVREDASRWLARITRGLRDDEGVELREWLKDPANRNVIVETANLWHGPDVVGVLAEAFPESRDIPRSVPRQDYVAMSIKVAATVCIVALGAFALMGTMPWLYFGGPSVPKPGTTSMTFTTAIGERREVELADRSVVTLNTRTRMTVTYSPQSRDVHLEYGEASFDVAPNSSRPFNVRAGKREFQALGTRFIVRVLSPDNVELTVTEGEVKVAYAPPRWPETPAKRRENLSFGETTLVASETALIEPGYQSVRMLVEGEQEAREAWQRGLIIFDGTPLEDALAEVDRYAPVKFVFADDKLRTVRVGGDFRTGDVDGLLAALRQNFFIDSKRDSQGRVVLTALNTQ
jgi:transmembrane sensor